MLTESEYEFINRLHHELMRQIFMFDILMKQNPRSGIRKRMTDEAVNHQISTLQPLMKEWGKLSMSLHKGITWNQASLYGRVTGKYILFTDYIVQVMQDIKSGIKINHSEVSSRIRHLMNRELMFSSL